MSAPALSVPSGVVRAARIGSQEAFTPAPASWSLEELCGRLTEISGMSDSACLTLAFSVVLDAQRHGETCAWVTRHESCFFPVDAWASGVDLEALPVIRMTDERAIVRASDRLSRSGAFGLVICDLGSGADKATALGRARPPTVPMAMQARLRGLAHRHDMAILCLTRKSSRIPSIGSLVSLRGEAQRHREANHFVCRMNVLKDKHRGPGWQYVETLRGPEGLQWPWARGGASA